MCPAMSTFGWGRFNYSQYDYEISGKSGTRAWSNVRHPSKRRLSGILAVLAVVIIVTMVPSIDDVVIMMLAAGPVIVSSKWVVKRRVAIAVGRGMAAAPLLYESSPLLAAQASQNQTVPRADPPPARIVASPVKLAVAPATFVVPQAYDRAIGGTESSGLTAASAPTSEAAAFTTQKSLCARCGNQEAPNAARGHHCSFCGEPF